MIQDGKEFSQLIEEYGALEKKEAEGDEEDIESKNGKAKANEGDDVAKQPDAKAKMQLMQEEERNRGSVPFSIYARYLKHAGGVIWAPVIILLLTLMQGASGTKIYCSFPHSSSFIISDVVISQLGIICSSVSGLMAAYIILARVITWRFTHPWDLRRHFSLS